MAGPKTRFARARRQPTPRRAPPSSEIAANGPAAPVWIRTGDLLETMNGQAIESIERDGEGPQRKARHEVEFEVQRNKAELTMSVVLGSIRG